ncbi:hypothetical protein [Yinghuangia sp. YIM S09857]|uniref:hypothetical protein n=1 Tax=Yinghuangia sp. YIM S09857 TaxID=3436929 RepID=UPI003F5358CA
MQAVEVVHEGRPLVAGTPEELLGLLIDGYAEQPDEGSRFRARVGLALRARRDVQTLLNAGELFDDNSREEIGILLERSNEPVTPAEWHSAVPLVLVASFYAPAGDLAPPRVSAPGQVWWIDPSTAAALLETLHRVRWLDVVSLGSAAGTGSETYRNLGDNGSAGYWWRSVP